MARTPISSGGWTEIVANTTNTRKIGVEGGTMRVITGATVGVARNEGTPIKSGQSVNIAIGQTVSGWAENEGVTAVDIEV